jgi:hypothetical protein
LGSLNGRDHPEDLGVIGKIILKLVLVKQGAVCELDSLRCSCGHGNFNEPSGSIKGGKFIDWLSNY